MTDVALLIKDSAPSPRSLARRALPWLIGLAIACAWDRAVYLHLTVPDLAGLESRPWYTLLYNLGRMELWGLVAAAFVLADYGFEVERTRRGLRRGVFLALSSGLGGLAAELAKLLFRRLRPDATDGWYRFRSILDDPFSTSGLGLPSSHAGVAFGAAFALALIFPRASPLFILAAVGCALSRILAAAHFFSDCIVGILLAYLVVRALHALDLHNNRGIPIAV